MEEEKDLEKLKDFAFKVQKENNDLKEENISLLANIIELEKEFAKTEKGKYVSDIENYSKSFCKEYFKIKERDKNQEMLIKHLQSENDRLNKAVSGIYQDIKMKSLKFILNAKIDGEKREIFQNLFSNYLK